MNTTTDFRHIAASDQQFVNETTAMYAALSRSQAIIEFDLDGTIITANDNFLRLMGYSAEEISGVHHSLFCRQETAESQAYRAFWDRLRAGEYAAGEFLRLAKDGREVYINASYNPIFNDCGQPIKIVKIASDITAAKTKSLEDQGKLSAISRSQAVIEFDLNGMVLTANANFLELMEYTLEDVQGQHHRMFVDDREVNTARYRAFWQRLSRGEFESGEFLRLGRDGKRVWIQATYNPILDLEGKPVKVVKFCSDVTAAKLAAAELDAKMAAVSSSNAIMEIDASGIILSTNQLMDEALGLAAGQAIGRSETSFRFDDPLSKATKDRCWSELRSGKTVNCELRLQASNAREVWLSASLSPAMGLDGELLKAVLIAQDVTDQMLARLDASGKLASLDRAQAVIEFDMTGKVLNANENFLRLMNYRLEEIKDRHHRMFVDPVHAATPEYQAFWDRLGRGEYESGEYKRLGKGAKECWIQATYNPIFDQHGKLLKVVKFAVDVTDAKLRNAEFQAKVSAIELGQAVIEFDLDGKVITANRNFLAAMGYTLRE